MLDRRKSGVTVLSVAKAARKILSNPDFEPESVDALAEAILLSLVSKDEYSAVDWDALLAFILKILPLILALL